MFQKILIILFISIVSPLVAFHLEWKKCLNYQVNVSPNSSNTWKMITRRRKKTFSNSYDQTSYNVSLLVFFLFSHQIGPAEKLLLLRVSVLVENTCSRMFEVSSRFGRTTNENLVQMILHTGWPMRFLTQPWGMWRNPFVNSCLVGCRSPQFDWVISNGFCVFFSEENPDLMECFQGIVEKFYDRDTIFRAIFYSFIFCKLPKRGLLFPLSKFERNRAEMRMKISISKKQDSCRQYIIVIRGAFILLLSRFSRGDDDNAGTTFGKLLFVLFSQPYYFTAWNGKSKCPLGRALNRWKLRFITRLKNFHWMIPFSTSNPFFHILKSIK